MNLLILTILFFCFIFVLYLDRSYSDVELTELLKELCDNYHFREVLEDSDVTFDYKLYPGATTTRNAILLLERIGYPEEIIKTANYYANSGSLGL